MKKFRYFLLGFRNAFVNDLNEMKKEYPVNDLWEKSNEIDKKFRVINEKTKENITKHIYSAY